MVIEENKLLDPVPFMEFHLLGRNIHNVLVITSNFLHQIGAGLLIYQNNLTQSVGLIGTQQFSLLPDLKANIICRVNHLDRGERSVVWVSGASILYFNALVGSAIAMDQHSVRHMVRTLFIAHLPLNFRDTVS